MKYPFNSFDIELTIPVRIIRPITTKNMILDVCKISPETLICFSLTWYGNEIRDKTDQPNNKYNENAY